MDGSQSGAQQSNDTLVQLLDDRHQIPKGRECNRAAEFYIFKGMLHFKTILLMFGTGKQYVYVTVSLQEYVLLIRGPTTSLVQLLLSPLREITDYSNYMHTNSKIIQVYIPFLLLIIFTKMTSDCN